MSVFVFGSINVDHVAYVLALPRAGETVLGSYDMFPGGKGCNQAVASARAGAKTYMLGAVGDDASGDFMLKFMAAENIHVGNVAKASAPTGVALISVDENSENSISVCPGANLEAELNTQALNQIEAGDIFLAQGETDEQKLVSALKSATKKGCTKILNPAPYFSLSSDILENLDIIIFNETEFSEFVGSDVVLDSDEIIERISQFESHKMIVTLGSKGLIFLDDGEVDTITGKKVDAIDTTGAGDCFCGSFVAQLGAGKSIREAAEYANIAASLSVTQKGAATSMPTASEVASV